MSQNCGETELWLLIKMPQNQSGEAISEIRLPIKQEKEERKNISRHMPRKGQTKQVLSHSMSAGDSSGS